VDDREFFRSVADRAGLSREEATDLTRATLQALAQRLSQGAVRELVLHLPDQLAGSNPCRGVTGDRDPVYLSAARVSSWSTDRRVSGG